MALGNCDSCGENPVAFMLSNVENGNTQGLCQWCLIIFGGQLAEALGLTEGPPETDTADAGADQAPTGPPAEGKRGRGRRDAASGDTTPPDAAPDAEETPATAATNAG